MTSKQTFAEPAGGSEALGLHLLLEDSSVQPQAQLGPMGMVLRVGVTITNEGASRWLEVGI
jgi:hypothetical protein